VLKGTSYAGFTHLVHQAQNIKNRGSIIKEPEIIVANIQDMFIYLI